MTNLQSAQQLTGVAETLMITLYARAVETQRADSLLQDPKAVQIFQQTDYDFDKYADGWASQLGVVIRVKEYDRIVSQFLAKYPRAIVINLGCGLCTRFARVDNGYVRWYEVDFPAVIDLKRKFFQETERYRFIAKSLLDFSWMNDIQRSPETPCLVVMEGVSPYLSETENKALVSALHRHLAPVAFIFDVLNRKSAKKTKRHDTVSKTSAEFKSGIDSGEAVEAWESGITLKEEILYLTQFAEHPHRLPRWIRLFAFAMVPLFKNSGRILYLDIKPICQS